MSAAIENPSTLEPNTSKAVDRIVAEAIKKYEVVEDDELVVEQARNKFRILFEEGSSQYEEAEYRLLAAIDPYRFAQLERDMNEISGMVDGIVGELLGGDLREAIPVLINKSKTQDQLDSTYEDLKRLTRSKAILNQATICPSIRRMFRKILLERELRRLYRQRKRELETEE